MFVSVMKWIVLGTSMFESTVTWNKLILHAYSCELAHCIRFYFYVIANLRDP